MEISFDEQMKFLTSVRSAIKEEAEEIAKSTVKDAYSSTETNELDAALAKAQGEYPKIHYNRIDPYFQKDYSDLYMILNPILPVLSKYGLSVKQWQESPTDGTTILHTKLSHASGQWCESRARIIPPKNDPLSFTSTKNQIKRSEVMSLLAITVSDDPYDDNAQVQMADERQIYAKGTQTPTLYNPRERSTECISKDQLDMLEKELTSCPDYIEEIYRGAQIESLADLPKNKFDYTVTKIRKVKEVRAGKRITAD